jgi:hypothetical protein
VAIVRISARGIGDALFEKKVVIAVFDGIVRQNSEILDLKRLTVEAFVATLRDFEATVVVLLRFSRCESV